MKKTLILLLVAASLLSGCRTFENVYIWGYETFVDDTLREERGE